MKRLLIGVACVLMMSLFFGCENPYEQTPESSKKSEPNFFPEPTGVIPLNGKYSFSAEGHFSVSKNSLVTFSWDGYAEYLIPIHDGAIAYCNGFMLDENDNELISADESRSAYPTDGFAIKGQWLTPDHCVGFIWYDDTHPVRKVPFSAKKR